MAWLLMAGAYFFGMPIYWPLNQVVVVLIGSGLLGAIPYSLLALWANRWMQGKTESEIRRKALRAPAGNVLGLYQEPGK